MPRLLGVALAFTLAGCTASPASLSTGSLPADLDGAWRLVSAQAFDAEGALVYDPEIRGGLLVVADGHYSVLWTRAPRPDPAEAWAPTEAERLVSFATMIAHAGAVRAVAPDTVRFDAVAAKSPEFAGGHETFAVRALGDSLRLRAVWAESAAGVPVPFYARRGRQDYVFVRQTLAD